MTTRTTFNGASTEVTGVALLTQYDAHIGRFYNASALRLSSIAGTPNAITAVVDPVLDVGLVAGMGFWLEPTADNTGTVTLVIGSETVKNIVDATGTALESGDLVSGTTYSLHYTGTEFRIMSKGDTAVTGETMTYVVFTTSGTLTKPTAFPDGGLVLIEAWGGGGAGNDLATGNGGGGGGYNWKWYRGVDLDTTETVTIGGGGAAGSEAAGGNTSVGSLCSAFGGGGTASGGGGGGGGQLSAGSDSAAGTPFPGYLAVINDNGTPFHGNCGRGMTSGSGNGGDGIMGGGGGGGGSGGSSGGSSFYGGAGGGQSGGVSVYGGDGGATGVGGAIPGGGGGGNGSAGARGEVRVRWVTG